jgi:hypothetical protein
MKNIVFFSLFIVTFNNQCSQTRQNNSSVETHKRSPNLNLKKKQHSSLMKLQSLYKNQETGAFTKEEEKTFAEKEKPQKYILNNIRKIQNERKAEETNKQEAFISAIRNNIEKNNTTSSTKQIETNNLPTIIEQNNEEKKPTGNKKPKKKKIPNNDGNRQIEPVHTDNEDIKEKQKRLMEKMFTTVKVLLGEICNTNWELNPVGSLYKLYKGSLDSEHKKEILNKITKITKDPQYMALSNLAEEINEIKTLIEHITLRTNNLINTQRPNANTPIIERINNDALYAELIFLISMVIKQLGNNKINKNFFCNLLGIFIYTKEIQ